MSNSISNLLIRNLRDVFGENDPARRRAAIDELWAEDGVFYDPNKGAIRGRDAIDRMAGAVKATHPDFRYQLTAAPQEYCDAGMVPWISGRPGEVPAYSGRDFVIARDGRIVALYMFFDKLPRVYRAQYHKCLANRDFQPKIRIECTEWNLSEWSGHEFTRF